MDNIQLACTAVRIVCYRLWQRMRGVTDPPPKPEFTALVLGLDDSGKTSQLCILAGESLESVQPTKGFHIKDIILESSTIHCKEVGGSEKIRKYWHAYVDGMDGLIYMINGAAETNQLNTAIQLWHQSQSLFPNDLPKLVLVTHNDRDGCKSTDEMRELLNMEGDKTLIHSVTIKDKQSLETAFNQFSDLILNKTVNVDEVVISTSTQSEISTK